MSKKVSQTDKYMAKATVSSVRISPRKARLVMNLVKGMQVERALHVLKHTPNKAAALISGALQSAVSNAREQQKADVDKLWVSGGFVNMGRTLFRWMPGAHGRANPIRKRSSHITILVDEI